MATQEQKDALRDVAAAIKRLNAVLETATKANLFIDLSASHTANDTRNSPLFIQNAYVREFLMAAKDSESRPD